MLEREGDPGRRPRRLAAALLVAVAGCGASVAAPVASAQEPVRNEFVARLGGTDSFAGIVVGQGKVLAFVCNGTDAGVAPSVWGWFRGRVNAGRARLRSGDLGLRLRLGRKRGSGVLTLADGAKERFRFREARGGNAGLYRGKKTVDGTSYLGGWIVRANGATRGAVLLGGNEAVLLGGNEVFRTPAFEPGDPTVELGDDLGELRVKKLSADDAGSPGS